MPAKGTTSEPVHCPSVDSMEELSRHEQIRVLRARELALPPDISWHDIQEHLHMLERKRQELT